MISQLSYVNIQVAFSYTILLARNIYDIQEVGKQWKKKNPKHIQKIGAVQFKQANNRKKRDILIVVNLAIQLGVHKFA